MSKNCLPKLLFHFESLWGVGHAVRSLRLLNELKKLFDCTVLSGSSALSLFPCPQEVEYEKLPEIHFSSDYSRLITNPNANVVDVLEKRYQNAINTFLKVKPDVLVVEMFPFGRHVLWKELLCLFELAQSLEIPIITSLRDVYVYPSDAERCDEYFEFVSKVLNVYNPLVLIHSAPEVQSIDDAIPGVLNMDRTRFIQTGYIGRNITGHEGSVNNIIRCAIGGGRKGEELLEKTIQMFNIIDQDKNIEICLGAYTQHSYKHSLNASHPRIEVLNFSGKRAFEGIENIAGWVVTGGYNSWMDILATRVPTIVVPLDEEQKIRSLRLSKLCPWVRVAALHQPLSAFIELWKESKEHIKLPTLSINTSGASKCSSLIRSEVKDASIMHAC